MTGHPDIRRALVTGGAGFIGHHLAGALLKRGIEVTVLDNLSMGRRENVPAGARFIEGDVRNPEIVSSALQGVDIVFHEAAIVSIRASVEGFVRDAEVNLMGTLNLLQRMAEGRVVKRAVLASSMAVYADSALPVPVKESWPLLPISPYGIAKLAAEQYWLMMCRHFGICGTALRYFNTYGPNQTPTPYVGVITIFINKLLRGEAPVIFGDGEQRRDFVHVEDVVSANLSVMEGDAGKVGGRVFNVGTGHATSVNDIARELSKLLGPELKAHRAPAQGSEMRNSIADVSAIRETLGWNPKHTQVNFEGVVNWWRAQLSKV
jgi:UDP-glucose 4-epimerase